MNVVVCAQDVNLKEMLQKKEDVELFFFNNIDDIAFPEFDLIIVDIALCSGKLDVAKIQSNKTVFVITNITQKLIDKLIEIFKVGEHPFYYTFSGKEYVVDLNDIVYFESRHREVRAYYENGEFIRFYSKLDDVQKRTDDYVFLIRVNKSCLVNYNHCCIKGHEIKVLDKFISISRTYKEEFKKRLEIIKNM